jgi:hypothetical protein
MRSHGKNKMSRSTSLSLLRFSSLFAVVSAVGLVACAGSDVPERPEGSGATGGSQSGSVGGTGGTGGAGSSGSGNASGGTGGGGSGGSSGSGSQVENGGSGGTGGGSDCDGAQIIISNCGASFCHGGGIGTFATDEASLAAAVDTASMSYASSCGSGVLIDDSDATQGVIYNKVSGATCGGQMPPGNPLSPADQDCVRSFLTDFEN